MQLYSVAENGTLRKITRLPFAENSAYIIDDFKNIYLWIGRKASKKKKELSHKKAEALSEKRDSPANVQIINQGKEFGAFLAMMDILKKGMKTKAARERRTELEIEYEDTVELIDLGLEPDLEGEITITAYELSQEKKSYEELCKDLAKAQLSIIKGKSKVSAAEINKKAKEIHKSSSTYEELCWLISELNLLLKKKSFE